MKKEDHLLERMCSQFTYEKFPRTTQSTCNLVDAVQQHHNISQVGCALIQVNVCVVETWEIYLAPCKSSDIGIFPESQACTATQSPDLFMQVPTESSPYLTTLPSSLVTLSVEIVCSKCILRLRIRTAGWNFGPSRSNKFRFQPVNYHRQRLRFHSSSSEENSPFAAAFPCNSNRVRKNVAISICDVSALTMDQLTTRTRT